MTAKSLNTKVDRLARLARKSQGKEVVFMCYWGDEKIDVAPGTRVIITEWGSGEIQGKEAHHEHD